MNILEQTILTEMPEWYSRLISVVFILIAIIVAVIASHVTKGDYKSKKEFLILIPGSIVAIAAVAIMIIFAPMQNIGTKYKVQLDDTYTVGELCKNYSDIEELKQIEENVYVFTELKNE